MNRKMFFAQNIMSVSEPKGYGYLYNWYSINHADFATNGWHVPSQSEYNTLQTFLGGYLIAGGKMKETGYTHWNSPNTGATNSTGFTSFGSGYRHSDGSFKQIKEMFLAWLSGTNYYSIQNNNDDAKAPTNIATPIFGHSVRLIKDSTTLSDGETSTMTDYDGNTYNTICIGTQEWTVQNWKCTKLNDGTSLTKVTSDATWAAASTGDEYYCAYDNDESNV